jgi:predicted ATP-grasp superfamily ATP-dependent carboligase
VGADLNALGVVRSLAAGGMPIVVLGGRNGGAAMDSRHGRKIAVADTGGEPLLEALSAIGGQSAERPVLFLTEEKSVRTVSGHRDLILSRFLIRLPDHERLMALMDKTPFQALAADQGFLIPRAVSLRSDGDLADAAKLVFPCVLKPAKKDYNYGARFQKAYVVADITEVQRLFKEIAPVMSDLVVQEWIEGEDSDIYFCLVYIGDKGELVASFTGRKLRSWPPRIGGTASCISAPDHAEELTRVTVDFFRVAGFSGMGSMEYKRDRRDGRFHMIEPTVARTDFQEEVATVNGVNIPLAAYQYESGRKPPGVRPVAIPRLWREPVTDKWARAQQSKFPEDGIRHAVCDAYFRVDDPMPWLRLTARRIRGKVAHVLGK